MSVAQITFFTDNSTKPKKGIYSIGDCNITVIQIGVFGMPDTTLIRAVAPSLTDCIDGLKRLIGGEVERYQPLSKSAARLLIQEVFGIASVLKVGEEGFERIVNKALGVTSVDLDPTSKTVWEREDQLDQGEGPDY